MVLRIGRSELPAGGVAAIAFAVLVFALDLTLWLAVGLAVATYLGVMLVWPPITVRGQASAGDVDTNDRVAFEAALDGAAALRVRAAQIANLDVQARVVRMSDHAGRILETMREDGNVVAAPEFHAGWVTPLQAAVTEYVRLYARDVKSARARVEKFETCSLARFEAAIDAFDEELNRTPATDVVALQEVLESHLRDLDTFGPVTDAPARPASEDAEPPDASAATKSFSPGAAAARNAARYALTPREHEIVLLLAQRLRNKEMANRLFIAVKTVENHVARVLDKLDLESRDDVRDFAIANGLLPPTELLPYDPPSDDPPTPNSPSQPE